MSLMAWIREHLARPSLSAKADRAIDSASEVINSSRSLRKQLEPFTQEADPFASMYYKKAIAAEYESHEEFDGTPRAPLE